MPFSALYMPMHAVDDVEHDLDQHDEQHEEPVLAPARASFEHRVLLERNQEPIHDASPRWIAFGARRDGAASPRPVRALLYFDDGSLPCTPST